jgi:hypothetical protein
VDIQIVRGGGPSLGKVSDSQLALKLFFPVETFSLNLCLSLNKRGYEIRPEGHAQCQDDDSVFGACPPSTGQN